MSRDVEWPDTRSRWPVGTLSVVAIATGSIGVGISLSASSLVATTCSLAVLAVGVYWYGRDARQH
ncbi:hypothetical protein [Halosegnis longus]|uniref:Uncharacterized protein n=1 Tax=Halosegnis longus TaxID=2216012 RepID=A0AAJ4R7K1_9EURY|nr:MULTISPECIES: hypothetical protein [Halobacteriales]RNJ25903.1 hypothetical protein Nmn1133_03845 [Salella cibi]